MLAVLYVKIQMFQHHLLKRMFPSRIAFDKHLLILYMKGLLLDQILFMSIYLSVFSIILVTVAL